MDQIQQQIEEGDAVLECIDRRLAGESCDSILEKLSSAGKTGFGRVAEIVGKAGDIASFTAKLLVAVIIKNIVFPLVFLMIAVKCSLPVVWYLMRLVSNMKQDARGLRAASGETG